jgi:hypothetical protein
MTSGIAYDSRIVRDAVADAAYLEALVPAMRRLGVVSLGDVSLGPAMTVDTPDEMTDERKQLAEKQAAAREERMRFGASGGPRPRGPFDR